MRRPWRSGKATSTVSTSPALMCSRSSSSPSRLLISLPAYSGVTYAAVMPPSTTSVAPVMNEESSQARKRAARAISCACPGRPIGMWTSRRAARIEQGRDPVLAAEPHTLEVDGHHTVPRGVGRLESAGVVGREDAGVVVEDVQAVEGVDGESDHRVCLLRIRDVGMDECGVPAGVVDRVDGGLAVHLDDVGDDDASTFPGEQLGCDPADPARRAGDQRHLAVQSPHLFLHRVGGRAIIPHPAGVHHHRRARSSRELPAVSSDVVRPRRVLTAALCVAIASLGISTTAPQAGAATHVSRPKAAAPTLDWKGCGGDNECAKLMVPLDYDHPDNGKTIKVALLRARATDKKTR